ncbi:MAG: AAA family ATPase [Ilumatobacteraceae bacterium]|nr:AAA family ATPase [Ilumatobacteraceae bacterium]
MTGCRQLIEREEALAILSQAREGARMGGCTMLVTGEAGVGKTALVDTVADGPGDRVLRGACEPLFTARPLGPFLDIAHSLPEPLSSTIAGAGRVHAALPALLDELTARPSMLIIEDVHWADKASLDLIALLGRRMAQTASLMVVTFRDDELALDHPLRHVLGALVGQSAVERIRLQPLSLDGVASLLGRNRQEAQQTYQRTGGNPFFITEVMAEPGAVLPASVADAVLGRAARLEPSARRLLEALSIVPGVVSTEMVSTLGGANVDHLDRLFESGMVVRSSNDIAFRHELTRETVAATVDPIRAVELHRAAMVALISAGADPAVIAHHAECAGATDAVRRFAREAADVAVRVGAHREAAAQYGRAIRAGNPDPLAEAELLELGGHQAMLSDRFDIALDWLERAVSLRRDLGDAHPMTVALMELGRVQGCYGRPDDATKSWSEAFDVISGDPDCIEHARALSGQVVVRWTEGCLEEALRSAHDILELALRHNDADLMITSLRYVGALELCLDDEAGWDHILESAALAKRENDAEQVGSAYMSLLESAAARRRADVIDEYAVNAIEYCADHGLDLWTRYLESAVARSLMDRGQWDDATAALPRNDESSSSPLPRVGASIVLGLMRARRGDAGARTVLLQAPEFAVGAEAPMRASLMAAVLEAAWLGVAVDLPTPAAMRALLTEAGQQRARWEVAAIAWWMKCLGLDLPMLERGGSPWWLMVEGRFEAAASEWRSLGCPYEEALALCFSPLADDLEAGLGILDRLGATPARAAVTRDLRLAGRRNIPRGTRPTTRSNPAGLTARELEVARLLAEGLRNVDIAERLHVTPKTVDHHVSAVLAKLAVPNRSAVAGALHRHKVITPAPTG